MNKKDLILKFITEESYRPMRIRDMMAVFCVPKSEKSEFREIINELVSEGKIEISNRGLIKLASRRLVEGIYMGTTKGFGFVRVDGCDDDIFISKTNNQNAFDGDRVLVSLNGKGGHGKRKKEGEVVKIIERNTHTVVGTFERNKNVTFVIPDNDKIASDIYIPKGATMDAKNGQKVVVELSDYGTIKRSPEGYVTQILGYSGEPGVDVLSIIKAFDIVEEFTDEVYAETKKIPDFVSAMETENRVDLRNIITVTIDGEDAKDLDDAITISQNDDRTFELGVHIADVSNYVLENSKLDNKALERSTSVYLADRVIPMLPTKLSNGICSLNEGVDRLTLSCIMQIDEKGRVISHKICESVINVNARMNYSDVFAIISGKKTKPEYDALAPMFLLMEKLAIILRKSRESQGAIDFDFPECKMILDKNGMPVSIEQYDRNEATKIIEEFMLVANKTVAEEYYWLSLPFLYRVHDELDMEKIEELSRLIRSFGFHLKSTNENIHPKEIQKLINCIDGDANENFISRMCLRAMKKAEYSTENRGHFGLATRYYCHFTSPIRRYPDLQIHRIIKENLHSGISGKRFSHYEKILPKVAEKTSVLERRADEAQREVEKLKKAEYMKNHIGEVFEGVVSGVTSWGIYVELPNTIEGMVRLSDMFDDDYIFYEDKYIVKGRFSNRKYTMGMPVVVRAMRADTNTRTIDFIFVKEQ